jgi:hypothetical protein
MAAHIRHIEEMREPIEVLPLDKVEAFLLGDNDIDDSAVYIAIQKQEKRTKKTASVTKTEVVFILDTLIKESSNAKPRKRRQSEHVEF